MDLTHLHLVLNHFPIIGTLIGAAFLLYGVISKNSSLQKIALASIVVMSMIAIPVLLTGEPAEETVENIGSISETTIEAHEEAAEVAFWVMEATGVLSLLSLILLSLKNSLAQTLVILSLASSFVSFGLMARTGYLGGQIRHTELSGNVANTPAAGADNGEKDED